MSREDAAHIVVRASMKALPKRKGNFINLSRSNTGTLSLNESPSEKEGKYGLLFTEDHAEAWCLNESPSEKEGKLTTSEGHPYHARPQ